MSVGNWIRLSLMMFLQYLVWGIWLPGLAQFMGNDGIALSPSAQGWIFTVYGFGAIIGPFVVGQMADRYFATEKVMAVCHALGGLLLLAAAYTTSFWPLFGLLFLYSNLYMPTIALTNSISFRTLGEDQSDKFAYIRLWGTIGWIVAGTVYGMYLGLGTVEADRLSPFWRSFFNISVVGTPDFRDCLRIPAVLSFLYAAYCLTLPHTPPVPAKETDPIDKRSAVLEALELMRNRSFAVLIVVSGLIGIMLAFYFGLEAFFLGDLGTPDQRVTQYMTIGQWAELLLMFTVPLVVSKLGIKKTMILGAAAWAIRFGLSAIGQPYWLMISTIALHGFAFGYFFVPGQMFVDRAASEDIKATAQNFLLFVVYGMGTILGSVLSGQIRTAFSDVTFNPETQRTLVENTRWFFIWIGPTILTILCILAFAALFRETRITKPAAPTTEPELA